MSGLLASYWFGVLAIVVLVAALTRNSPAVAMGILLVSLAILLITTAFANGAEVIVTEDEVIVRRRLRSEWIVAHADLQVIEEHIPMRPRARSLAGWVFRADGTDKATVEIAMFSPRDRRKMRAVFADILVSPDLGRPPGVR